MHGNKYFTLMPIFGVTLALVFALTASPGNAEISVGAPAFQPGLDGYDYALDNNLLINSPTFQSWLAPVQLPHGATITKMTFYWSDNNETSDIRVDLYQGSWDSQESTPLATLISHGNSGWGSTQATKFTLPIVDSGEHYYLKATVRTSTALSGVVIEYTYRTSLPLILRDIQGAWSDQ